MLCLAALDLSFIFLCHLVTLWADAWWFQHIPSYSTQASDDQKQSPHLLSWLSWLCYARGLFQLTVCGGGTTLPTASSAKKMLCAAKRIANYNSTVSNLSKNGRFRFCPCFAPALSARCHGVDCQTKDRNKGDGGSRELHGGGIGDAYRILMIIAARDVRRAQNTALRVFVLFWLGRVTCCIFGLRSAIQVFRRNLRRCHNVGRFNFQRKYGCRSWQLQGCICVQSPLLSCLLCFRLQPQPTWKNIKPRPPPKKRHTHLHTVSTANVASCAWS